MSGYLTGLAANLCFSIILAYAAYLPLSTGQLNLGIAGYMAIGAYVSAIVSAKFGLPIPICVILGALSAAFAGLVVAASVARMEGIYLSLATFAFAEVVAAIIVNIDALGGANGYVVVGYLGFGSILIVTVLVVGVVAFLVSTRIGLVFTAVRNDERAASVFGVGIAAAKVLSFTLGAACAGIGGALYAHYYSYIEAQNFNFLLSANAVLFVLLGGVQTWWGPILGATAITLLPEALRASGEWRYIGLGAIIIVLMVLRPEGLLTRSAVRILRLART